MSIILSFAFSSLTFAQPFDPAACESYLGRTLHLIELLREDRPGIAHVFPSVFLSKVQLYAFGDGTSDRDALREHVTKLKDGAAIGAFLGLDTDSTSTPKEQPRREPYLRIVRPVFRDLEAFIGGTPASLTREDFEIPIRVLPREWQLRILRRVAAHPPPYVSRDFIDEALAKAERSSFTLGWSRSADQWPPGQGLNPSSAIAREVLHMMMKHYFPDDGPVDEALFAAAFARHVTFRVIEPPAAPQGQR